MTDESSLRGRVALVTGGGRGIGRAIALALAGAGAKTAVAARSIEAIRAVSDECIAAGGEAWPVHLDVTDRASCEGALRRIQASAGHVDILVNNAGIAASQTFLELDDDIWERMMAANAWGAMAMTQAALPGMLSRRFGRVIAISSIAGRVGAPYVAAYTASKHALIGLMRALAVEYGTSGVTFNSVCPGYVDTPMTERTIEFIMRRTGRSREDAMRPLLTPQGRLIQPDEVAAVCLLLAGEAGAGINGQAINVDGGSVQS